MDLAKTVASNSKKEKQVLIVDDDSDFANLLCISLKQEGFTTSVANDGNEGIAIAMTRHPDLILLDIMMPKRSGFLVMEYLLQRLETPIPVIVMTGNSGVRHQEYAELLCAEAYFVKPFKISTLLSKVRYLMART